MKYGLLWTIVLAALTLEIVAIRGVFSGSDIWTGIFAVITALNVRAIHVKDAVEAFRRKNG